LTQVTLAELVGSDKLTVSSWERGRSAPRPSARPALAEALGVTLEELADLLDGDEQSPAELSPEPPEPPPGAPIVRGVDGRPRIALAPDPNVVAPWLDHYVLLEQIAARIEIVQLQLVPGLLQTRAYAEVIESTSPWPTNPEQIAQRVELRMDRQNVVTRRGAPGPLELAVILGGEVLDNRIGTNTVMANQLDHLVSMAHRSNVDMRIVAERGVTHHAASSFELVFRSEAAAAPLARTLDLAGAHYHEDPAVTSRFAAMVAYLQTVALPADESIRFIEQTRERYR
jgi:DNA-binding XRE family transcriptional regulator